jgi:hypothetical protein
MCCGIDQARSARHEELSGDELSGSLARRCELCRSRRSTAGRMRDELTWVGELLGSVRDTDVLIDRIEDLATTRVLEPTAVSAIVKELEDDRRRGHVELVDGLGSRRCVELVDVLLDAGAAPPMADEVDGERRARRPLRKLVRKTWRRVGARGGAAG